jgi:hypothetical protein
VWLWLRKCPVTVDTVTRTELRYGRISSSSASGGTRCDAASEAVTDMRSKSSAAFICSVRLQTFRATKLLSTDVDEFVQDTRLFQA